VERRPGARKATPVKAPVDPTPVERGQVLADDRLRPIPTRRPKGVGDQPRIDPTRVSGPIRWVLEPMLWAAFVSGVVWLLVALDPGLRTPARGVVIWENTLPLAILVGALLTISTTSALMWLATSTSATRARTSFAGLGMLASGWLFAKLHPVDPHDFQVLSWLSIGLGVLLVTVCAVPWPTTAARTPRRPSAVAWALVLLLVVGAVVLSMLAWEASRIGLVGVPPGAETGWDLLLPFVIMLGAVLAAIRFVLRRPARPLA